MFVLHVSSVNVAPIVYSRVAYFVTLLTSVSVWFICCLVVCDE